MKKLAYIILGFIIGAVLTYYFCPRPDDMNAMAPKFDNPTGVITILEAEVLSANWAKNNKTEIDSTLDVLGSKKVTRSVKWTLKNLEDYINYAKKESDTVGYTMTGVRVYLGNYGEKAKPSKKNRNTMFIVPTGYKNTSKASSFNINFSQDDHEDIPIDPLNDGSGGNDGYSK